MREQTELEERLAQIRILGKKNKSKELLNEQMALLSFSLLIPLDSIVVYHTSDECVDYGQILQKFSNRDVNAVFVLGTGDVVQVCKLEYLMNDWQVQVATVADRAHIITW